MIVDHGFKPAGRRSIRLGGYDYSRDGGYFVTVCAENRECLFGSIADGAMSLNTFGDIVASEWLKTPVLQPNVILDEFVVMPDHFHGIVLITTCRGVLQYAPTNAVLRSPSQTAGAIVRGWKGAVAKKINEARCTPGAPVWQRNYYDHIIRNEQDLDAIRAYIVNNPARWADDEENQTRKIPSRP